MSRIGKWFSDAGLLLGVVVLLLVGLPLLAVTSVAARLLFLVGLPLAIVGGLLAYAFSPRFRAWFASASEGECLYKNLRLDREVALHPNHSWTRVDSHGALVGADDLAQAAIGPVDVVELPAVGTRVHRGEPLFALRHGERCLSVRSPWSGTVTRVNPDVRAHPELVNDDPFGRGWAVQLQADRMREERSGLLRGNAARTWFRDEVDRLVAAAAGPTALPTMADGGLLVGELHRRIEPASWDGIVSGMFHGESAR